MNSDYQIAIIGGGVTGCFIARELARYQLRIILLEKGSDVANETSKANSGIVHAGYDASPGTLKARFNVQGNPRFDELCRELDVPFKRNGSITIATDQTELDMLEKLVARGEKNKVDGLRIVQKDELFELEPNLNRKVIAGLRAGNAGIVDPFALTIALAENAVDNNVEIKLNSQVLSIEPNGSTFSITTPNETLKAEYVINCAGVHSDAICGMVTTPYFKITPRKGEYIIFDKSIGNLVSHSIFQCPSQHGKGVLVTPTVHGNLLVGPNSENINDKNDISTTVSGLESICKIAGKSVEKIPFNMAIANFSGLRATDDRGDFIIESLPDMKNFINVAGIESPGLTSSPAIAEYVVNMLQNMNLPMSANKSFNPVRKPFVKFAELSDPERFEVVKKNPLYGKIVCRCETITEGEIVDAIHRNIGGRTLDGIKKRVRAGMGRCQGGFCAARVMEILARELNLDYSEIRKNNPESFIVMPKRKRGAL